MIKKSIKTPKACQGFSLIEVLVAMLIAAGAIGATMIIHTNNLRQVLDNSELSRAELVLVNMISRMQVNDAALRANAYRGTWQPSSNMPPPCVACSPVKMAVQYDIPMWQLQASEAGLSGANLSVNLNNVNQASVWRVQIDWPAHDVNSVVQRTRGAPCAPALATNHCVSMLLRAGL